nr:uncharacterized protein LOC101249292 [Solanum lycopersicum]
MAQFSYNLQKSESTGSTPFELATGQQPQTPHSLPTSFEGNSLGAYHLAKGWEEQLYTAKSYLDKVEKENEKVSRPQASSQGFQGRRHGFCYVQSKVGKILYKLELPPHLKIHPVFHASVLKTYHEDKDDPSQNKSQWAPITITTSHDREIEAIIDYKAKRKREQQANFMFPVHWKGQTPEEATWEKYEDLWQFKNKCQLFLQRCVAVVTSLGGGDCDILPHFQPNSQQPGGAGPSLQHSERAGGPKQAGSSPSDPRDLERLAADSRMS